MVGFGSSLRMARRVGWERSYLDYETLKMLLSQIESVYEEEEACQHHYGEDDFFFLSSPEATSTINDGRRQRRRRRRRREASSNSKKNNQDPNNSNNNNNDNQNNGQNSNNQKKKKKQDYRDELFVETDSDLAFASSIASSSSELSTDDERNKKNKNNKNGANYDNNNYKSDDDRSTRSNTSMEYRSFGAMASLDTQFFDGMMEEGGMQSSLQYNNNNNNNQHHPSALNTGLQTFHTLQNQPQQRSHPNNTSVIFSDEDGPNVFSPLLNRNNSHDNSSTFLHPQPVPPTSATKTSTAAEAVATRMHHQQQQSYFGFLNLEPQRNYSDNYHHHDDDELGMGPRDFYYATLQPIRRSSNQQQQNHATGSATSLTSLQQQQPSFWPSIMSSSSDAVVANDEQLQQHHHVTSQRHQHFHHHPRNKHQLKQQRQQQQQNREREKRKRRRQVRRQRRAAQRKRRRERQDRRVPAHLRLAHFKARDITERFLGLLRAEVEKVVLFAHSRLGELADTAGSLRFPSHEVVENDDDDETYDAISSSYYSRKTPNAKVVDATNTKSRRSTSFEHSLSDGGGLHPSASSSEDEGEGGHGASGNAGFPWSDTSSDEEESAQGGAGTDDTNISLGGATSSHAARVVAATTVTATTTPIISSSANIGGSNNNKSKSEGNIGRKKPVSPSSSLSNYQMQKSFSGGGLSVATHPFSNVTTTLPSASSPRGAIHFQYPQETPDTPSSFTARRVGSTTMNAVQRQILHFAELRRNRPVFQRMDHIVGEDLLLLSAVDEADGYTAVAVELLHLLRFLCVNAIAVRKICRKHDRLLMNRMLGGYYHRKRQQQAKVSSEKNDQGNNLCATKKKDRPKRGGGMTSDNNIAPNAMTLGGIVSRSMGDDERNNNNTNSTTALLFGTGRNQSNKLVGVYDVRIQEICNSNTVQVISSCIALALSEYEVSHSRADALSKLNNPNTSHLGFHNHYRQDPEHEHGDFLLLGGPSPLLPHKQHPSRSNTISTHHSENSFDTGSPPSTASSISLTRLRYTVVSIFALREVARLKQDSYKAFMARASLVFTGPHVVGEGLDGCSRAILDFFVAYSPDAALLLDSEGLFHGLQRGQWKERPIGNLMLSCLAMALVIPSWRWNSSSSNNLHSYRNNNGSGGDGATIMDAVSVMPISGDVRYLDRTQESTIRRRLLFMSHIPDLLGKGINPVTLQLNRMGMFLYAMNYYIAHSTATAFVVKTGAHSAYSATVIGGANLGALIGSILQCRSMLRHQKQAKSNASNTKRARTPGASCFDLEYFRRAFLVATAYPMVGNILHAIAVSSGSVPVAVVGRIILGFGSTDLLHRHLLSQCLPAPHIVYESSNLLHSHILGVVVGLLTGGFLALFDVRVQGATISSLHSGSYFMASLWLIHFIRLYFFFQSSPPLTTNDGEEATRRKDGEEQDDNDEEPTDDDKNEQGEGQEEGNNSFSSAVPPTSTPDSVFYDRSNSEGTDDEISSSWNYATNIQATYGSIAAAASNAQASSTGEQQQVDLSKANAIHMHQHFHQHRPSSPPAKRKRMRFFLGRVRRILFFNVAIPVTMAVIVFMRLSHEILFTSCAIITDRYFSWNGSTACFLLGILSGCILPINYIAERVARSYDERTVIRRSLSICMIAFLIMINWVSLANLTIHVRKVLKEETVAETAAQYSLYDWVFGPYQYLCGVSLAFVGLKSLELSTLALMSKVAPSRMRQSVVIHCASIVTVASLAARFLGNVFILVVGISHRTLNADLVNSLVVPLVFACLVASYIVRRHFFFLM